VLSKASYKTVEFVKNEIIKAADIASRSYKPMDV